MGLINFSQCRLKVMKIGIDVYFWRFGSAYINSIFLSSRVKGCVVTLRPWTIH